MGRDGGGAGANRSGRRHARPGLLLVALAALLVAVLAPPASAQGVSIQLSVAPLFPTSVTVGQANLPAQLSVSNDASTGLGPITLTQITLNPACGSLSLDCAPPDPGVFSLAPTATGTAGACAGRTFDVTAPDANGRSLFVPRGGPVVLQTPGQPNSSCLISFTFSVLKAPTIDALPGAAGLQTAHVATVTGSGTAGGNLTATGTARAVQTSNVDLSSRYHPLTPSRILDTRFGTAVGPGATVDLQVTGQGGVPVSGVSAVVMNVTVTGPTGGGYLTAYPTGTPRPTVSNLNFVPGDTVANLVVVKVGGGGRVSLFNSAGTTHVIADVAGWYSEAATPGDGRYVPVVPSRLVDTRLGAPNPARLGPGESLDLQVSGRGGVPQSGAQAAVLNVTVTNTTATGYLTVHPTGEPRAHVSNLNFDAGETVPNRVFARLGSGGRVTIFNSSGLTDVIVDVGGWYTGASLPGPTGTYSPLHPVRIVDTRLGLGVPNRLGPGSTVDVQVTGRGGVPVAGVSAVVLNVTAVAPDGVGYLTLYPTGAPRPHASDLNFSAGEIRANLVVVAVGSGGRVSVFTPQGTHLIFDVAGWYS